jgi:hypothetical protein
MGCCSRPPSGSGDKKELAKGAKYIGLFVIAVFVLGYVFG